MQLKWNRLKDGKCPKCNSSLVFSEASNYFDCAKDGFTISKQKFENIVNNLYQPKKPYHIQTDGILEESVFDEVRDSDLEFNSSFRE